MPDIDLKIITHKLSMPVGAKSVGQKRRGMNVERKTAIKVEVERLLAAGFTTRRDSPMWSSLKR